MTPTPGDVHVNQPLTNISIAFMQDAASFVADRVFPNISVSKQSDVYYTYDRGDFNRDEAALRAPGTESSGSGYKVDNTPTYYAPVYAYHKDIPDQLRANADSVLQLDTEATMFVTHKALIKRERTWVSSFFAGGIWTGGDVDGVAGAPGAGQFKQWNDAASTPIEDIRSGKAAVLESTGFEPNTLVLGYNVYNKLIDHPDIVDRVKYGNTSGVAQIDESDLANLFKVSRVLVMKAIYNSANDGATNVHSFIGGKKALLCYVPPAPGLMTPSAGYTFSWTGYLGAGAAGQRIKRFRMEPLASDRIEMEMAYAQKLIAADLGYFFDTAVA